jgi:cytochrome c oxidase cbb3-type subunit 2
LLEDVEEPETANDAAKLLNDAGAKARVQLVAYGPDIERGWGDGRSVAADFLFDRPALPGQIRLGPDLANVGRRLPNADWHLLHLYDPTGVTPSSVMPPYRFLFERRRMGDAPSPRALRLSPAVAETVGENYEVLPTDEAHALVAYLLSLRTDVPLLERPITTREEASPEAGTNAVPANPEPTPASSDPNVPNA